MTALYITADQVGIVSGGGIVTQRESEFLGLHGLGVKVLDRGVIDPTNQSAVDPFVFDSLAEAVVGKALEEGRHELAHFYAGTFTRTIARLKAAGVRVSYTAAAHDRRHSIEEFGLLGYDYPYAHIKDDALWAQYVQGYKQADLVICPSRLSADVMRGYGCKNVVVVPHGVMLPAVTRPLPRGFRVGYFGALGPDKGLVYLLRAWKTIGYKDARLLIGGRGSEESIHMIRAHGGGNVQILGFVESVSDFYDECSVYVQPSTSEGYGIEILEAMAHGRPVIASVGAGGADAIDEGVDGFKVPIRSPQAIAEKIEWCRTHPDALRAMGENAKRKAQGYSWDKIRPLYSAAWANILAAKAAA
jgi:glycosyltransferase involved in cell wall biosynthesis